MRVSTSRKDSLRNTHKPTQDNEFSRYNKHEQQRVLTDHLNYSKNVVAHSFEHREQMVQESLCDLISQGIGHPSLALSRVIHLP